MTQEDGRRMDKPLICFDVDGTLDCKENDGEEYLKGIIPEEVLVNLWKQGFGIAIVSPSPYFPDKWKGNNHWFQRNGSNDYRFENIKDAMECYNTQDFNVLYVDDLIGNHKIVNKVLPDVICYTPEQFMKGYGDFK
jgi:hypothetical protein